MPNKSLSELRAEVETLHDEMDAFFEKCNDPEAFASSDEARDAYFVIANALGAAIPKIIDATIAKRAQH
jgi:hypothetical protein